MTTIYVQFEDATETKVISVFGVPQDVTVWPNQGAIEDTDPRYQDFVNPPETTAQKAAALLAAGLTITSTGSTALNGTYACDALSQADIVAIETSLNAGKGFPGGATTFSYPDATGALHSFSEANFTDFAAAVRDYVYALKSYAAGQTTTLPVATATIA